MRKLTLITSVLIIFISYYSNAQYARFPVQGVVEFEKRANMHPLIKRVITKETEAFYLPAFEQYKKTQPQFKTWKSTLYFSRDKALFVPEENTGAGLFGWLPSTMQVNTIYSDLNTRTSSIQKRVFEEVFLVKDSIRNIKWKLTNETREVAGYTCRRANAVIMDSVYVVAFYTEQIPVSAGPETFAGLPGMILGLALPHEHITWFATSVSDKPLEKPIAAPTKGKVVNSKTLRTTLESSLKQYKDFLNMALKAYLM